MKDDFFWVLQLIDRFYQAATDDSHWPDLLKDVRQFLDGCGMTLYFADAQLKPTGDIFRDNVPSEAFSAYRAHFHNVDIRLHRSIPGSLNSIVTDLDLVDQATIERHEFYQDFLRPIGHRYVVSAVMDLEDGTYSFCSCHRGLEQEHADSDVLERAALLLPHVKRSLQLRRRLSNDHARGKAAFELLDDLGQAVFMLDGDGRIAWQNGYASRLLEQQDGLITSDGELRALSASAGAELQSLVKSALAASSRPGTRPGGMMTMPRPSLKRPYQILVTPLSRMPEATAATPEVRVGPCAAVFVMDLEQKSVPPAEVLSTLYGLTPAEARLATALSAGVSVKDYAERGDLSVNYVRWLLKQVEAKTDTRRLTELIQLLARQGDYFGAFVKNDKEKDKRTKRLLREIRKKK